MEYADIMTALEIFSLGSNSNFSEIKQRHKQLVKKYHPDTGCCDNDKIRQINAAYKLLEQYCSQYRYAFSHAEFLQQHPEERLREQFANDPVWGSGK